MEAGSHGRHTSRETGRAFPAEQEKQIRRDIEDAIIPRGGEMTVLDWVKKYLSQKTGVRHNAEANYNFVLNIIKKRLRQTTHGPGIAARRPKPSR